MAKRKGIKSDITVIVYKDQQLFNLSESDFPISGWLYPKGASLKGVQPKNFSSYAALAAAVEEHRGIESKLYLNIIEENKAVLVF